MPGIRKSRTGNGKIGKKQEARDPTIQKRSHKRKDERTTRKQVNKPHEPHISPKNNIEQHKTP